MSQVSVQLRDRCLDGSVVAGAQPLCELRPGCSGVIAGFSELIDPATGRRLIDLGFVPGASVTVVRRAPLRDPVIYRVADYEIALRKAQARDILVSSAA